MLSYKTYFSVCNRVLYPISKFKNQPLDEHIHDAYKDISKYLDLLLYDVKVGTENIIFTLKNNILTKKTFFELLENQKTIY